MTESAELTTRVKEPISGGLSRTLWERVRLLLDNPVMTREFRSRMRGTKAYWMLLGYVGLLTLIALAHYLSWSQGGGSFQPGAAAMVGKGFFQALFGTQAVLIAVIVPAMTSGTITLENEQRAYELLACTGMSAREVVLGKLMPAVLFSSLLLTCSLPLASIAFMLGGVSPGELLATCAILIASCCFFAAVGVGCSAVAKKTASATTTAILSSVLYMLVTFAIWGNWQNSFLAALNPTFAARYGMESWYFFKLLAPAWVPSLAINLLMAALVTTLATCNLPLFRFRRVLLLRVLWAALFVVFAVCTVGNLWGTRVMGSGGLPNPMGAQDVTDVMSILAFLFFSAVLISLPFFCGVRRDEDGVPLDEPAGEKRSPWTSVCTAPVYLVILLLIAYAVAWLGIPIMGQKLGSFPIGRWLGVAATAAIPVLAFGAISVWLSRVIVTRWAAGLVGFIVIFGLSLLPFLSVIDFMTSSATPAYAPIQNTLYASPYMALGFILSPQNTLSGLPKAFQLRTVPFWGVTDLFYVLLGLGALLLIRRRERKGV